MNLQRQDKIKSLLNILVFKYFKTLNVLMTICLNTLMKQIYIKRNHGTNDFES